MGVPSPRYLVFLVALLLGGCGGMGVEAYRDRGPALLPEEYFAGPVRAWGTVQDRSGTVRRSFTADLEGAWEDGTFVLRERFLFDDGERTERTWRIRRTGEGRYEGSAADVVGTAHGRAAGMAMQWRYTLRLEVGGREIEVDFDDWLFAVGDGVVVNRATMRKFGFRVGELTVFFRRGDAPGAS